MPSEIHVEAKPLDVIFVNGKWYLLADKDLRDQVASWSASGSLDPADPDYNPDGFVSASAILGKFAEEHNFTVIELDKKVDKTTYDQLYAILLDKRIALTASYNDLVDVPSFGGARVESHTLVFTGQSSGQEAYLLDQLDQTANVIGTGVLGNG